MNSIHLQIKKNVAWVELVDSKNLNPFNTKFVKELEAIITELEEKENTLQAAVFYTQAKNFSVGLDFKEFAQADSQALYNMTQDVTHACNRISALPFPTLALLKGFSIGGAMELSLSCDFRFASADTQISVPAVKIGFCNPAGVSYRLPKIIGVARALDMLMSAKMISSQTALDWGLISEVTPPEKLLALGEEWATKMLSFDQIALRATKLLVEKSSELSLDEFTEFETVQMKKCALREEPLKFIKSFWKK